MNVMKRRGFFALLAIPLNTGEGQDNLGGVQFLWDQGKERLFSKLQQLKFYFKYTHNQLPSYFNNNSKTNKSTNYKSFEIKMSSNVHSHNTHYKSNLDSEQQKHKFAEKCLRRNIVKTINNWGGGEFFYMPEGS